MFPSEPRIGIIGSGAIGGFYGLLLARAGFDVHFLLRRDFQAVATHGLRLKSRILGDVHLRKVNAYHDVNDMPPCDWLLLGTKATSNINIAPLVVKAAAAEARVVVLQNGLAVEDRLRPLLPGNLHLLGGLCWVGVERRSDGALEHIALGNVDVGYHSGPAAGTHSAQAIVTTAVALFKDSGIDSAGIAALELGRWKKLIWNIPYNGLSVLLGAGTRELMADQNSRLLIHALMLEVTRGASACGQRLPDDTPDRLLTLTDTLADYYPSMYHDNLQGRPMELEAMYAAPLDAAARANCPMPKVAALLQALRFIDARNPRAARND
jgi:2-dehydropantoate 2-reductase